MQLPKNLKRFNFFARRWIVIPKLQNEIILASSISTCVVMGIFLLNQFYVHSQLENLALSGALGLTANGLDSFQQQTQFQAMTFALCGIIAISLGLFFGLLLSNRIAGPIYRLNQQLDGLLNDKEFKELHFRTNDYLKDTGDRINQLAKKIAAKK